MKIPERCLFLAAQRPSAQTIKELKTKKTTVWKVQEAMLLPELSGMENNW